MNNNIIIVINNTHRPAGVLRAISHILILVLLPCPPFSFFLLYIGLAVVLAFSSPLFKLNTRHLLHASQKTKDETFRCAKGKD